MIILIKTKIKIVRGILIIIGIFLLIIGLGHIFFPEQGHQLIGQTAFDASNPWMLLASRGLGVHFLVMGLAAFIAAFDPLKHAALVFIVVSSSALIDLVRATGLAFCPKLWFIMLISIILWLLIVIFYPYKIEPKLKF
jgi:hypothetical protein